MKKKLFLVFMMFFGLFMFTGCDNSAVIEGNLSDIMEKVYEGIDKSELPNDLMNIVVDEEVEGTFLGTADVQYVEAIASESPVQGVAHSVILIRMKDDITTKEMKAAVEELGKNIPNDRWIINKVDKVNVVSNRNLILVVLDDDHYETMISNFKKIK